MCVLPIWGGGGGVKTFDTILICQFQVSVNRRD